MTHHSRRSFLAGIGNALVAAPLAGSDLSTRGAGENPAELHGLPPSDPRDLPAKDRRLEIRTLDTPRTPRKFASRSDWDQRAARLREQVLSAAGLLPMPERTQLHAEVFDRIELKGFSIEKVYFESYPHFYCTGNLYRPLGEEHKPPFPAILCPHGHWTYGRLEHCPGDDNGCSVPQRCMNFALQGIVAFAYDMVGYNDSFQIPHDWLADPKAPWALSQEAVRLWLWGVNLLGLQLWNSIRALDFLAGLPDVDPKRIGVTGASGGGTQTFLLTAVDDRVRVCAPVNMISHYMQGGDLCENAPNLRVDTDNMEFGALAAPRPMLMVSATGDWTRDTERVEYPAIAAIYELLEAKGRVTYVQFPFLHNYNRLGREAVYSFFNHWFAKEPEKAELQNIQEKGGFSIDPGGLLVFSRCKPPADALDAEHLKDYLLDLARSQLQEALPRNAQDLEVFRNQYGLIFRTALMAEFPPVEDLRWWPAAQSATLEGQGKERRRLIIGRISAGDRIPAELVTTSKNSRKAALIVHAEGLRAALGTRDAPSPLARELGRRGYLLLSVDTFQTGEAREAERKMEGKFFPTYNRTDDMQRVQDILTSLAYLEAAWKPERIVLVGQSQAGLWCLLARPFLPGPLAAVADAVAFASNDDSAYLKDLYVPLLRRAGDFRSAALLAPPSPLVLHNLGEHFAGEAYRHAFDLQGAADRLRLSTQKLKTAEIVAWLTKME